MHQNRDEPRRQVHDPPQDDEETPAASAQSDCCVVSRASARRAGAPVDNPQRQAAGSLPILRSADELPEPPAVLPGRSSSLAQMAEPPHARNDPRLADLCTASGAPSLTPTEDHSCLDNQLGESVLKNPLREICTAGSVRGEVRQLHCRASATRRAPVVFCHEKYATLFSAVILRQRVMRCCGGRRRMGGPYAHLVECMHDISCGIQARN